MRTLRSVTCCVKSASEKLRGEEGDATAVAAGTGGVATTVALVWLIVAFCAVPELHASAQESVAVATTSGRDTCTFIGRTV